MKIAFLVTFTPTTRVVVDVVDSSLEQENDYFRVVNAARNEIIQNPLDYINSENCEGVIQDEECLYNPEIYDKK